MNKSIHNSLECTKSELDLFYTPPTNTSIDTGGWGEIQPTTGVQDASPLEFAIAGSDSDYIQLNKTTLYLIVGFYKKDASGNDIAITNADACSPINNFGSTMFSQIDISFNGKSFETSNATYAYRAYLSDLLNYGEDAKKTFLQTSLFYKDTAYEFENLNIALNPTSTPAVTSINEGFSNRRQRIIEGGGKLELLTRVHSDIFNSDRYLLNNISVIVKFTKNKDEFCLMQSATSSIFSRIEKALLYVRKCQISPSILLAHSMALEKATAKYPIKRVVLKNATITPNIQEISLPNVSKGVLPIRLVIGMVDGDSFTGKKEKNPFNFKHYNLNKLSVMVDSKEAPYYKALTFDYDKKQYIRGYNTLFEGIDRPDYGNFITRQDYPGGYALYAYDLSPDLCSGDHFNLIKTGDLVVTLSFDRLLTTAVMVIMYLEYDNLIEINKYRELFLDYKI